MSGHSKWANIHVKKSIEDKKRAKIFTQLTKNIMIAVRASGNGDPNMNPSLRIAVDKARQANMPNENIQRAIKRGQGVGDATFSTRRVVHWEDLGRRCTCLRDRAMSMFQQFHLNLKMKSKKRK